MTKNMEIWNSVESVPEDVCRTIMSGRLKGMTDIKPQWRLQKLTEQFGVCGFGWYTEIVSIDYKQASYDQIFCSVKINLYVKIDQVWSKPIPGIGGSMFIAKEVNGLHTSDEAEKMAYTDALSVACKMIGIGAKVYMGHGGKYEENADKKPQAKPQPQAQANDKQWLNKGTDAFTKAKDWIAEGGTIAQIKEKYKLSKEVENLLTQK